MSRIIAGSAGGRRLRMPPGSATRPTSERVREALFSRLDHLDVLAGAQVLDLYAGSGALGLEAASRGASAVTLVDSARTAVEAARHNVRDLGLPARVVARPVEQFLLAGPAPAGGVDLVLLDPPYVLAQEELAQILALLVVHHWLGPDAVVVVERSARTAEPIWPLGLAPEGQRRYGETALWFAAAGGLQVA